VLRLVARLSLSLTDLDRGFAMAAPPLPDLATAEGRQEAISKLDPDFHGLMERKGISEVLQATLSNAGVKGIGIYTA
jgi:hypothetical protein